MGTPTSRIGQWGRAAGFALAFSGCASTVGVIFQALFLRGMAGGSDRRSLTSTFFPELLSMNCLMAGMVPVATLAMKCDPAGRDPSGPGFWFIMSMALLVGFLTAYPMNWRLVSHHMKAGMMRVRSPDEPATGGGRKSMPDNHSPDGHPDTGQLKGKAAMDGEAKPVATSVLTWRATLSCMIVGLGLSTAIFLAEFETGISWN